MRLEALRSSALKKQAEYSNSSATSLENTKSGPLGPTPTDLAYTAGFLDGEGCFIWNNTVCVEVKTTYPKILHWLKKKYGGSFRLCKPKCGNARAQFHWRICGQEATELCKMVLPYLREKHYQALTLIQVMQFSPNSEARRRRIESLKELKKIEYAAD